jgi:zinc protease
MKLPLSASATSAAATIVSATRHVLPNGMVALIYRNPTSPTVSVRGEVRVGAVHESAEKSGLAAFTGGALIRGSASRTFQQIVAETEERGSSVSSGGGTHSSGFGGKALAEDLPLIVDVLAEMLMQPTFPTHEVEKLRGQYLTNLRESEQDTSTQASRAARRMLFPASHPYSREVSGTVETVSAISRDDLVAFHQHYHPALASVVVVGDVEPPAVIELLERTFGPWQPNGDPVASSIPETPALSGILRRDVPMAGKVQSDLVWAVPGLKRSQPDYYAAVVGNMILGQIGMGGRLGEHVREEEGMAYYAYSGLEADVGAGPWAVVAGINPGNVEKAISVILREIGQFLADGPTEEELDDARAYMTGSLVLGLETNDGIASTLLAIERHGLGLDYISRYPAIINGVSRDEIVETARRYLSTERYVLAVAGPPL